MVPRAAAAAPGNELEMQNPRFYSRTTESGSAFKQDSQAIPLHI